MAAAAVIEPSVLPQRWYQLRPHAVQEAFARSIKRINVVPAGRRSGKTERAKRRFAKKATKGNAFDNARYIASAPTRAQAKDIFWEDLKKLIPRDAVRGKIREGDLIIPLWHGGTAEVRGMDAPARIEGSPIDHFLADEFGNMKAQAFESHVLPALSERGGTADLIGVPEGRNHYYDTALIAEAAMLAGDPEWGYFHWKSADILPAAEIESARAKLDERTFQQEYEASFLNFGGRAYYAFTDANKQGALRSLYDPSKPLIFCLDFNVSPGVAAIVQEIFLATLNRTVTAVIGEVYIPDDSNTPAVCKKLLTDWGAHQGIVKVYGDATGGARGTAKVAGSDWDIAKKDLRYGIAGLPGFVTRVSFHVKDANPAEKARVNAINSRCCSADQTVRLLVDPVRAAHVVKDFEGVITLEGGSGEINKKKYPKLTHISDALGYYVDHEFPVVSARWSNVRVAY